MLKATYLNHSGFLVELPSVTLLFDWWNSELPPLPAEKPLLVFASHSHSDHFNLEIFSLDAEAFLLGCDIDLERLARKGIAPEKLARCHSLSGGDTLSPLPDVMVEALPSTDLGVAFLVTADSQPVFHAGDLNWWHWAGEPDPWNPDMEVNFKRFAEPLRGRNIYLAMLPLDSRLGQDGFRGPKYFLELADIQYFLPMHQWELYSFTASFLRKFPAFAPQTLPVPGPGATFVLP